MDKAVKGGLMSRVEGKRVDQGCDGREGAFSGTKRSRRVGELPSNEGGGVRCRHGIDIYDSRGCW